MNAAPSRIRLIACCILAGGLLGSGAATAAGPTSQSSEPARVSFTTDDGVMIVGDYYAPKAPPKEGAPVVILLHMYQRTRSDWQPLVPHLRDAGFAVLAIDLRGHGESRLPGADASTDGPASNDRKVYRAMYQDVMAAYAWLGQQKAIDLTRFAMVGASLGCSVAIDYAARDRSVDAMVCLSPGTNYLGVSTTTHIKKCTGQKILLLASQAEAIAATELGRLAADTRVMITPEDPNDPRAAALHGTQMFGRAPDIERTITAFLTESVGLPATAPVVASLKSTEKVYHVPGTAHADRIRPENRRWFSSAAEAEARGLRPVKSRKSGAGQ
ncbi:MAG: alpha/beta fold hydrolase [Phycisphaerae bacterium]|nr:alpha/beta fold hydrolase [Phycisphaerae bacterium]